MNRAELYKELGKLKKMYRDGVNIIQYLQKNYPTLSQLDAIMISYDFQAGSYVEAFKKSPERKIAYCQELAQRLGALDHFNSILNVGVGEATILGTLLNFLKERPKQIFGLDISWSRLKYATEFLIRNNHDDFTMLKADLFKAPFMDNSIELVLSNHSLEPNGGREEEALRELYRISSKYVVINEPCYEWADKEGKSRMRRHGYVQNLHLKAKDLGYEIVSHEEFNAPVSDMNPTSCLIIKKASPQDSSTIKLACPITQTPLIDNGSCFFSNESLLAYPILDEIPCLDPSDAILATHLLE